MYVNLNGDKRECKLFIENNIAELSDGFIYIYREHCQSWLEDGWAHCEVRFIRLWTDDDELSMLSDIIRKDIYRDNLKRNVVLTRLAEAIGTLMINTEDNISEEKLIKILDILNARESVWDYMPFLSDEQHKIMDNILT